MCTIYDSPDTTLGRILAMSIIAFAIVYVPKVSNELFELMQLQSAFARASYTPLGFNSKHVIICGDISSVSLKDFFEELFCCIGVNLSFA